MAYNSHLKSAKEIKGKKGYDWYCKQNLEFFLIQKDTERVTLGKQLNYLVSTSSEKVTPYRPVILPNCVVNRARHTFAKDQEQLLNKSLYFELQQALLPMK